MNSPYRVLTTGHPEHESVLRVFFCGNAGDGKRTLLDRLPSDSRVRFCDEADRGESGRQAWGARWHPFIPPLGADATVPDSEQGINGDWVRRVFSNGKRKFILADIPNDEQYSRHMLGLVRKMDVVVMLVDAHRGVSDRTRHYGYLVSLLGVRHLVLAVNKMDLVDYSRDAFQTIADEFREFSDQLGVQDLTAIPISALHGDNVFRFTDRMVWYRGRTLADHLGTVESDPDRMQGAPFRFLVQDAAFSSADESGFSGYVASGEICVGGRVRIQPAGKESRVTGIVLDHREQARAVAGQSATLTLKGNLEIPKGSVISATEAPAEVADQFEAKIVSIHEQPVYPGRTYLMKIGNNTVNAVVTEIKYQVNVNTLEHLAADKLERNGIAVCNISLDRVIPFDPYEVNPQTGGFVLIDEVRRNTVGAGLLDFALRRAHNIHLQHVDIGKDARVVLMGHKPCVLWFTGLSGSGKSTVANLVEQRLYTLGAHTYLLDGDNVRHGLNRDLGFTDADRVENIRRVAEVSKLMVDAGLIVVTAFISPFRSERRMARDLLAEGEFLEVFMDTPLELAEQRDPKGLYKKARSGALKNFTGIDSPYEQPEACEVRIDTGALSAEEAADRVIGAMKERGLLLLSG